MSTLSASVSTFESWAEQIVVNSERIDFAARADVLRSRHVAKIFELMACFLWLMKTPNEIGPARHVHILAAVLDKASDEHNFKHDIGSILSSWL
jgi:hypothetical protein